MSTRKMNALAKKGMVKSKVAGMRAVRNMVRAHNIQDGDIVAILQGTPFATDLGVDFIAKLLGDTGRERCGVVVVKSFDDLTVLREEDMRTLGWQRIPEEEHAESDEFNQPDPA